MIMIDTFEGVKATVQNFRIQFLAAAFLAAAVAVFSGCGPTAATGNNNGTTTSTVDPNEAAATVNGKTIRLEEIERALKQQMQGQESKLSPLELAQARLQILETMIQQEVMFQKAEKEGSVPKDEDVTAELNRNKQQSQLSQEKFDEEMKKAGQTEATLRDAIKRKLAVTNLIDKVTTKIEPPKDSEIDAFYAGNKSAFIKKKGVKLAAIIIDPSNSGEGDTTVDEQSAVFKANEIAKQLQAGEDFAKIAREKSEDQSKFQGGDLGYIAEDDLRQTFSPQVAAALMNPNFQVGKILTDRAAGKLYILKLQERNDKDENVTLETPGIRQQVIDQLINARKQLLAASYQSIAMNEAKIVNNLAQKVVDNPNDLSGARPAGSDDSANTNNSTNSANSNSANKNAANANAANGNVNKSANAAVVNKAAVNAKPANANSAGTANANK